MEQKWVEVIILKFKDGKTERESWQSTFPKDFGIVFEKVLLDVNPTDKANKTVLEEIKTGNDGSYELKGQTFNYHITIEEV